MLSQDMQPFTADWLLCIELRAPTVVLLPGDKEDCCVGYGQADRYTGPGPATAVIKPPRSPPCVGISLWWNYFQ